MASKPILFNTEMVRAILDGRKTMTRRVIKKIPNHMHCGKNIMDWDLSGVGELKEGVLEFSVQCDVDDFYTDYAVASYRSGDILWVRETWAYKEWNHNKIYYKADGELGDVNREGGKWKPSIFMPREAARIFLRVTNVRVERLQEITIKDIRSEGTTLSKIEEPEVSNEAYLWFEFQNLWNSTVKKSDLDTYGWNANPWVWVYEFERVSEDDIC